MDSSYFWYVWERQAQFSCNYKTESIQLRFMYTCIVDTPLGSMRAAAADNALCGLWFIGQKYFPLRADTWLDAPDNPVFVSLNIWLKDYFAGKKPTLRLSLSPEEQTFRSRCGNSF